MKDDAKGVGCLFVIACFCLLIAGLGARYGFAQGGWAGAILGAIGFPIGSFIVLCILEEMFSFSKMELPSVGGCLKTFGSVLLVIVILAILGWLLENAHNAGG